MKPTIHILYKFPEGPWGGGNQVLKALRNHFRKKGFYSESAEDADVILFNSYPFGSEYMFDLVFKLKKRHPNKILIHRVDGPISHLRGKGKILDEIIFEFNNLFSDGTIFQSNWSRQKNNALGMLKSPYETIIMNAPDPGIFNFKDTQSFNNKEIKLIATSWSGNIRKGFDIYKFLDEHLDYDKFKMTFVGNSPIEFKNIRWIKPVPSEKLATILKGHDIFITASRNDPCSNSLIEAIHCGLPAVAINDGGHPEIIGDAGEFFENESDVIAAIEKVAKEYKHYQAQINPPAFDEIGHNYYEFANGIYDNYLDGSYHPKHVTFLNAMKFIHIKMKVLRWMTFS